MVEATCHCGAVKIEVPHVPTQITSCNCSICRRSGALMAYYAPSEVKIVAEADALDRYVWGDKSMANVRCKTCGCWTHWEPLDPAHMDRMGVNTRMMDPKVVEGVRVRRFDGAETWKWID